MKNRSSLYIGVMVLTLGALFLVMNVGATAFGSRSLLSIYRLWPLIVVWVGFGFFLPIFIWWDSRQKNYGLAMPGTIILVNGLVFLYCSLSRDWGAWAYLWTLEPFSVALGLLALYFLGARAQGLLVAALAIGGASLAVFRRSRQRHGWDRRRRGWGLPADRLRDHPGRPGAHSAFLTTEASR